MDDTVQATNPEVSPTAEQGSATTQQMDIQKQLETFQAQLAESQDIIKKLRNENAERRVANKELSEKAGAVTDLEAKIAEMNATLSSYQQTVAQAEAAKLRAEWQSSAFRQFGDPELAQLAIGALEETDIDDNGAVNWQNVVQRFPRVFGQGTAPITGARSPKATGSVSLADAIRQKLGGA